LAAVVSHSEDADRIAPETVDELYREFGDELRAYLTAVLKDREQAAEVLQVVFRKTLEQGHTATQNLRGWMLRVATQEAMLVKRLETRERNVLAKAVWKRGTRESVPDESAAMPMQAEAVAAVREAILTLPPDQQAVVRMRIYEDKTFAVIAAELGVPLGTVLTRMRTATQKLEAALHPYR